MAGMDRRGLNRLEIRQKAWDSLLGLSTPADIALLQEASFPREEWGVEPPVPFGANGRAGSRLWPRKDLVTASEILDYEPFRGISDHTPIAIEMGLD